MRISDWSSDVCSSDLVVACGDPTEVFDPAEGIFDEVPATVAVLIVSDGSLAVAATRHDGAGAILAQGRPQPVCVVALVSEQVRSEEHTSELQSLMRISYAVFRLNNNITTSHYLSSHFILTAF